jgi:hypothetical protein
MPGYSKCLVPGPVIYCDLRYVVERYIVGWMNDLVDWSEGSRIEKDENPSAF